MNKKKKRTLAIWALVISLVATTVAYAILQTTLSISGSVTRKGGTFDVHFTDVAYYAGEKLATPPQATGTSLSFKVTLNKPGDYTTIRFKILNNSPFEVTQGNMAGKITVGDDVRDGNTMSESNKFSKDTIFPTSNGISCLRSKSPDSDFNDSLVDQTEDAFWEGAMLAAGKSTNYIYLKCQYNDTDELDPKDATVNVSLEYTFYQASTLWKR